jgi:hypothetical protein
MSTQANSNKNNAQNGRSDLDRRYGRIGISAVAAAMSYNSHAKKPAPSPVAAKPRERTEDEPE